MKKRCALSAHGAWSGAKEIGVGRGGGRATRWWCGACSAKQDHVAFVVFFPVAKGASVRAAYSARVSQFGLFLSCVKTRVAFLAYLLTLISDEFPIIDWSSSSLMKWLSVFWCEKGKKKRKHKRTNKTNLVLFVHISSMFPYLYSVGWFFWRRSLGTFITFWGGLDAPLPHGECLKLFFN